MLVEERNALLDKAHREQSEERRLRWLEEKVDRLRAMEDPEDHAAIELIRSVAAKLTDRGSSRS